MLLDFYKQTKPAKETNFFNTTMQLNRNYSAMLHVDKNNHGPSYIIALGEYQGDRLWCYDKVRHDFVVSMAICVYACAYACADAYACAYACACAYAGFSVSFFFGIIEFFFKKNVCLCLYLFYIYIYIYKEI